MTKLWSMNKAVGVVLVALALTMMIVPSVYYHDVYAVKSGKKGGSNDGGSASGASSNNGNGISGSGSGSNGSSDRTNTGSNNNNNNNNIVNDGQSDIGKNQQKKSDNFGKGYCMPEDKACTHRFTGGDNGRSEPGPGSHQPCLPFCGQHHGSDDHGKTIIIVKQKHSNKEVHITKTINQIVIGNQVFPLSDFHIFTDGTLLPICGTVEDKIIDGNCWDENSQKIVS
jgi:hypothetical protein